MGALFVQSVFDETGDTGIGPHSSRFLVVAGIVCSNLEPLRRAVARTRRSLGKQLRDIAELKAWHTPPKVTAKFLTRIAALDIEIYTAILDKRAAAPPEDREDWYRRVCAEAVRQATARHDHVIVTLDKRYTKPSLQDRLVQSIVAGAQRPGATLSFVYVDSQQERALQAADAVAWGIYQRYEQEDETFYSLIAEKIVGEVMVRR
jgi:hypothetical protein